MSDDSGNLSIDFLAGFTIFMIGFVWVISMIPGLLVGLQAFTIDYDAVAYRTGVILVEDPGQKATGETSWELADYYSNYDKDQVKRFGLAVSRDDPNILALDKVNRFFDDTTFTYPDDYHDKAIFGDYPYKFNISFRYIDGSEPPKFLPDSPPLPDGYGYIRRFVKIKGVSSEYVSNATIDGMNSAVYNEGYINSDNTTKHTFVILLNNTELTGLESPVRDPAYQIIPAKESFMINLTNLSTTMDYDPNTDTLAVLGTIYNRSSCFNIRLKYGDILVSDGNNQVNIRDVVIDEDPIVLSNSWQIVQNNLTLIYNTTTERKGIDWEADQIYIFFTLRLVQSGNPSPNPCPCEWDDPVEDCKGSRFLNNTDSKGNPVNPFTYDYTSTMVTQPRLRDGLVEVAVW